MSALKYSVVSLIFTSLHLRYFCEAVNLDAGADGKYQALPAHGTSRSQLLGLSLLLVYQPEGNFCFASLFKTGFFHVSLTFLELTLDQSGLELRDSLASTPKCCDQRHALPLPG